MTASANSMPEPAAVIKNASRHFIAALKRHKEQIKKDPEDTQRLVHEYILPHFDLQFTARLILGRYWGSATAAKRKAFSQAFINHLIAVYQKGIVNYRNDSVQVLPLKSGADRQYITVDTLVHIPDSKSVSVDYAMHKVQGTWKIFDVRVMDVSFVLTYRNEYQAEIKRTSLSDLIKNLRKSQSPANVTVAGPTVGG